MEEHLLEEVGVLPHGADRLIDSEALQPLSVGHERLDAHRLELHSRERIVLEDTLLADDRTQNARVLDHDPVVLEPHHIADGEVVSVLFDHLEQQRKTVVRLLIVRIEIRHVRSAGEFEPLVAWTRSAARPAGREAVDSNVGIGAVEFVEDRRRFDVGGTVVDEEDLAAVEDR